MKQVRKRHFMDYLPSGGFPAIDSEEIQLLGIPNPTGTPERRLLLAVLERAILDYVGNDEREQTDAHLWIFGDDSGDDNEDGEDSGLFSFSGVCKALDLDVRDIAEKIRLMPKRGPNRVAPWYFSKAG